MKFTNMITPHKYATAAIQTMFDTKVQRNAVSAFVFVRHLDMTRRQASKELKCSQDKIRTLINSVPFYQLQNDDFKDRFDTLIESLTKYIIKRQRKQHKVEVKRVLTRNK